MSRRTTRRDFLKQSTLAGVGFWVAGGIALGKSNSANEKLNIACIGVGGKGGSDTDQAGNYGNIVALCDIDDNTLDGKAKDFPKAKKYNDFRKMFDEMGKTIDAVTVSTPDHTHAVASIMAIRMKKHVYCQKPLTHSVHEARLMRELAAKYKVCTQMGNQGTASDGLRRGVELIRAGVIGPVREVHVWTNRPIWPQAPSVTSRPKDTPKVPKHVHWDLFLGPAPNRNYSPAYHPFKWRGWWDFGTGALGDMACHTANLAFMALKLGYPTSVVAESGEINPETYPGWAKILYAFPKREDMPPVKFYWYEGSKDGKRVLPPTEYTLAGKEQVSVLGQGEKLSDSGSLLVGDKGVLFSPNDYGESYKLLPQEKFKDYKKPEKTLPRNGNGDDGMKAEWVEAIKENKPSIAMSNFNYAAMLTETILLGNVAMRVGKKIEWDGPKMKVTNCAEAEQYIKPKYREGWKL
jgi:predicted dehydrogenase